MGIYMRVAYLWSLLTIVTLVALAHSISRNALAVMSSRVLHDGAMQILTTSGPITLYVATLVKGMSNCVPFLLAGIAIAMICRVALFARDLLSKRRRAGTRRLSDRFGVTITMMGAQLAHNPDTRDLSSITIDPGKLPPGISAIECDALALLAAHPNVPADVDGHHGTTLAKHSFTAWTLACQRDGVGSLAAQLAICHDLGKIRTYVLNSSGQWEVRGLHRAAGLQVVRDFPSFSAMSVEARHELMLLLTALLTGCIPCDLSEAHRVTLRAASHVDFKATADEKRQAVAIEVEEDEAEASAPIDASGLHDLLKDNIHDVLERINVNRVIDANATLEGFYLPESEALLIPEQWLRFHFGKAIPAEIAASLQLTVKAAKGRHPARDLIVDTAHLLFDTFDVFGEKQSKNGAFQIQTGIRTVDDVIAIKATGLPEALKKKWGKWKYEIDVL